MNTIITSFPAGTRLRLAGSRQKCRWTVRAAAGGYVVATRQAPFSPKGTLEYTILQPEQGIRGAANTIGNGWTLDAADGGEAGVQRLIQSLCSGKRTISTRNRVPLHILDLDPGVKSPGGRACPHATMHRELDDDDGQTDPTTGLTWCSDCCAWIDAGQPALAKLTIRAGEGSGDFDAS